MKHIDSIDMNVSTYTIKMLANSLGKVYDSILFRFAGTNESGQTVALSDLGKIVMYYNNLQKQVINFTELAQYLNKKGGALENASSSGAAFTISMIVPQQLPDDFENGLFVPNDTICRYEWQPSSGLAAKVDASSRLEVIGVEKDGTMRYIYGWNRTDLNLASGLNKLEPVTPFNISSIFAIYDADVDFVDITVDGRPEISRVSLLQALAIDTFTNRLETYAATAGTTYVEFDLLKSRRRSENLNSDVRIRFQNNAADSGYELFWNYLDYQPTAKQASNSNLQQLDAQRELAKAQSGGSAAVTAISME